MNGTSAPARAQTQRRSTVHGSEYSRFALELARERGLDVVEAPVTLESFEADRFDVVTAFEVFEHVRDPVHEVAVIAHALRSGGLLYCTTPNFNALSRRILGSRWSVIEYPEHLWYFTPGTLRGWLERSGFVMQTLTSSGISVSQLRDAVRDSSGSTGKQEELRTAIERSIPLHVAKAAANRVLSALGAGDTLKGWFHLRQFCVRGEQPAG